MAEKFDPPGVDKERYHCPHCEVYAHQALHKVRFFEVSATGRMVEKEDDPAETSANQCQHCYKYTIWIGGQMRYPDDTSVPPPHSDMPSDVAEIYSEARSIVSKSPRAACGLLRLAVELLMPHLDAEGSSLHQKIGDLVERGLNPTIQQALDSMRIIGNDAVHGGEIVADDGRDVAARLFTVINLIIEQMIRRPRQMEELYNGLPENKRAGVEQRDQDS